MCQFFRRGDVFLQSPPFLGSFNAEDWDQCKSGCILWKCIWSGTVGLGCDDEPNASHGYNENHRVSLCHEALLTHLIFLVLHCFYMCDVLRAQCFGGSKVSSTSWARSRAGMYLSFSSIGLRPRHGNSDSNSHLHCVWPSQLEVSFWNTPVFLFNWERTVWSKWALGWSCL